MKGAVRNLFRRFTSVFLAAVITVPMLYGISFPAAEASPEQTFEKTVSNTQLGANGFAKPVVPATKDSPWQGSYLYYGEYNGSPVRYRILDFYTQKYKEYGRTILLDCDRGLYFHSYDGKIENGVGTGSSVWKTSDLRDYLNGEYFFEFGGFTDTEWDAIVESTFEGGGDLSGINMEAMSRYKKYVGLYGDKVFLLGIEDVLNPQYGYYDTEYTSDGVLNHGKIGPDGKQYSSWWLRSMDIADDEAAGEEEFFVGLANSTLGYSGWQPNEPYGAVSPAMNIDSDRVLFSTAVQGTFGEVGTEYKLTLIDEKLSITPRNIQRNGNTVSFKGIVGGFNESDPPRIRYFITKDGWNYGTLFGEPQTMLAYGEVTKDGDLYSFTIPSSVSGTWNEDYCIYITAEDINGKYETDYASRPVFLNTPATFTKTADNTMLGIWDIETPRFDYTNRNFHRSLIWYGKYNGQPVAYRALERDNKDGKLLVDSDEVLFRMRYNPAPDTQNGDVWQYSEIRVELNDSSFLNKPGVFTDAEKSAIYSYTYTDNAPFEGNAQQAASTFTEQVGLNGDQIFLLDVQDIYNHTGYFLDNLFYGEKHTAYDDGTTSWWVRNGAGVRTVDVLGTGPVTGYTAGIMKSDGKGLSVDSVAELNGVSPAMYLSYDKVAFATAIKGELRDNDTEYKLTVIDPEINLKLTAATVSGKKMTMDYTLSGKNSGNVDQFSYVIVRNSLEMLSSENVIIAYGKIPVLGASKVNRLSFNLPDEVSGRRLNSDFYVYIIAEDINGMYETDYCSNLARVYPINLESFDGKNSSNTRLGTRYLAPPATPQSEDDFWKGSYIIYGHYDGFSTSCRVLDNSCWIGQGSGEGILLQSDSVLMYLPFNESPTTCDWDDSTLKAQLNGDAFLNKEGVFTQTEKEAIIPANTEAHDHPGNIDEELFIESGYVPLDGEKIFVLDVEDLMNEEYGYTSALIDPSKASRIISDYPRNWNHSLRGPSYQLSGPWTRNGGGSTEYSDGDVMYWGIISGTRGRNGFLGVQVNEAYGVAPAYAIRKDSVIMMTAASGKIDDLYGSMYVLTLHNPGIELETGTFTHTGGKVEFDYELHGQDLPDVNQLSYIITTKDENSFLKIEDLKYYGPVNISGEIQTQTRGSFYLPTELTDKVWGEDYRVYIIAEQITGRYETDYASEMQELTLSDMLVSIDLSNNGKTRLNRSQLEAIDCLIMRGLIREGLDEDNNMVLDLDKNSTNDVKITRQGSMYIMERLSTCSITEKSLRFGGTQFNNKFKGIIFIFPQKSTVIRPRFDGHALRLSDEIGVVFGVDIPENLNVSNVRVDFESSDGRTLTVPFSEAVKDTSDPSVNRYLFTFFINSLEIEDTITATLYYGNDSSVEDTYCALDYIRAIQNNPDLYGEKNVAMVNALLDYGYYFQHSGWKDNGTHNAVAEPAKYLEDEDVDDAFSGLEEYTLTKEFGQSGIEDVRITLTLNSRTALKIYVKLADGVSMASGGYQMSTVNGDQYYVFTISNIGPRNLGKTYTLTLETNRGSATVSASAMYYVNALMNSYTLNAQQLRAMSAYYNYYMAAFNYNR